MKFNFSFNQKVRSLQLFNHFLAILGISYCFYTKSIDPLVLSVFVYWVVGLLGISIGLHRLLSHRSFSTYPFVEKLLSLISVITTLGSPIAWLSAHRTHHSRSDKDGDPHSPHLVGNFKAWFGFWNMKNVDIRYSKDLRKEDFQRFIHKNYFKIIFSYCFLLFLIDPILVIFVYAIPACFCFHATSSVVVIAHRQGYRNHFLKNDKSKNSWITSLITLGDGWHNNHHARPWKWSNWEKWWEIDIPAIIIFLLRKRNA